MNVIAQFVLVLSAFFAVQPQQENNNDKELEVVLLPQDDDEGIVFFDDVVFSAGDVFSVDDDLNFVAEQLYNLNKGTTQNRTRTIKDFIDNMEREIERLKGEPSTDPERKSIKSCKREFY